MRRGKRAPACIVNGKRKRKQIYGRTRKEVAEQLKVLLRDQQRGLDIATQRQTVAQFLTRWLTDVVQPGTSPATYRVYEQLARIHLIPVIGHHQIAKLTSQHVQAMLRAKSEAGASPATVQRIRDVLRNALNQAMKWDLVARNVATLVDPPKVERARIQTLTPEQGERLLKTARGDRLEALYRVALSLGLREGEALGLRWQDTNLDKGTLQVTMALQLIKGELLLVKPKTATSARALPLPPTLVTALRDHRVRQLQDQLLAGTRWHESDPVFTTTVGTPIHPGNLLHSFYQLLERAGLHRMRFHNPRHSCASLLAAQGVPARVAMGYPGTLGHSTDARRVHARAGRVQAAGGRGHGTALRRRERGCLKTLGVKLGVNSSEEASHHDSPLHYRALYCPKTWSQQRDSNP